MPILVRKSLWFPACRGVGVKALGHHPVSELLELAVAVPRVVVELERFQVCQVDKDRLAHRLEMVVVDVYGFQTKETIKKRMPLSSIID